MRFKYSVILLLFLPQLAFASASVSMAYGGGEPDDLHGGRAAVQDYWNKPWLSTTFLELTGYWDYSIAYWHTQDKLQPGEHDDVTIIALAPVFRVQGCHVENLNPYFEASIGASWMNHDTLGHRDLGAKFAFQDLLGFGVTFGKDHQFDVSYHFLHYSNAKLFSPNEGIDVKYLISFKYVIK